jgi:FixJ family two-component response regulator
MSPAACVVYIVDGDAAVRQGLARVMDSAGLEPSPCDTIESFLGQASGARFACTVLDVDDPRLRDPALRARLRDTAATIPIVALSARDDPEARRTARDVGARSLFRKPVDAAALLDSIGWVTAPGCVQR